MDRSKFVPWHIGYVVSDADAAAASLSRLPGMGEWDIFSCGDPPPGAIGDLEPIKCAYATFGGTLIELVQPLTDQGFFARELRRRGSGLHHWAYVVPDGYHAVVDDLTRSGWTKPYRTVIDGIECCMLVSPDGATVIQLVERLPH